ncbi:MAG: LysR family transcriptional regulator [Myxococcota bacterium]
MDRLQQLRVFSRVVERGNLSRAAKDLQTTQPTVSKAISELERSLRAQLLLRSTRQVTLTDAGRRFYARCRTMLETWDEATSELAEASELRGTIRLHGPVVLGELYLGPIAVEFQRRHPQVRFELTLFDGFVDLIAERADLAVRLGTISDPSIVRRRFGTMKRLLVATPAYVASKGGAQRPQDLRAWNWVRFSGLAGGDSQQVGRQTVAFTPTFIANNAVVLKDALLRGLGVGLVTEWLVRRELESGRLVEVLPKHPVTDLETSVVFPTSRFVPARVRAFVEALESGLRDALVD